MIRRLRALLFENRSESQTVVKNATWLTVSQFGARLIRAGFMVYLARLVGAEGYGITSYALSLAALISSVTDLGIGGVITREGSKKREEQLRYLATGATAKFLLILVAAIGLMAWSVLGAPQAAILPLVILIVAFDGVRDMATALFRAQERMELEAYVQVATNVAIALAALAAAWTTGATGWILAGYAAGCALGALAAIWPLREHVGSLRSHYDRSLMRDVVRSSWTFGIVGLVGGIMLNTDAIMLAWFHPATEVGLYAAAQRIIQLAYVLPLPIASALFPMVARIADDRDAFKRVVENASHFLLIVGTGGALALLTASSATIHLLYGNAFAGATTNLAIMSLTLVPSFLVASLGNALFALRRERELVGYAIVAAASNIIGNLILIPRFGGPGSAFATLFAQTALLGYLMWVLKRAAKIRLVHNLPEIIVATIASIGIAVIGAIIGINGIITGALVLLTFMATLYALGESLVRGLWIEAQKLITHD